MCRGSGSRFVTWCQPDTEQLDYDQIRELALQHRPKLLICGYSAYPRVIDFEKFRRIADEIGAYLLADIAHIAGLVATNLHPSPIPIATSSLPQPTNAARS